MKTGNGRGWWRRLAVWVAAGLVGLTVAACDGAGGGTGGPVDAALVGGWRLVLMSVNSGGAFNPADIGWSVELDLRDDGSLGYREVWEGETSEEGGSWSAEGGSLDMNVGWATWAGPYGIAGSRFTGTFPNYDGEGNTGTLTFERM
jgi:hypothetical protein